MKFSFKNKIISFIEICLKILYIFPIHNNRILFSAYSGKQYSCNPKYISEYLEDNYKDKIEIIWAFNEPEKFNLDKKIKKVKFKSLQFIYYALTAKVVVDNVESWSILPKRKGQFIINTWHGGGAYKGVGLKRKDSSNATNKNMIHKNKKISLYISSSKAFTDMTLRKSFMYNGEVLECGMPRNDILINEKDNEKIKKAIRQKLKINDYKILLYAPTFRSSGDYKSTLNYSKLIKTLEKKSGEKWKILYRSHYYENINNIEKNDIIDVSQYPDMQELLLISDILITDYSSSMWDFSLMKKPVFLFVEDLEKYNQEREFYTPIESWPYILTKNNEELWEKINSFNYEEYKKRLEEHHQKLGSCETGIASQSISDRIIKHINL